MNLTYETDRLLLSVLDESYSIQVLAFLSRNRTYFDGFELAKADNFYTEDFQRRLLYEEYSMTLKKNRLRFYIFRKENPQRIIGTVSFGNFRPSFQSCQTGYKLDPLYQHRGYATEALSAAVDIAARELRLHRITAYVLPDNIPSIRLLERLEFAWEGTARDYAMINGIWRDHLQYARILQ